MRLYLFALLPLLTGSAYAGVVEVPVRSVPAASVGAAGVSFDGAGPLKPWVEVPGTPFVQVGPTLIDTRARGALELLKSTTFTDERGVVGIFEKNTTRVVNGFSIGSFGVKHHADAFPPSLENERSKFGGYVVFLRPNGETKFFGSGAFPAKITPAVQRSVLRYVGVRPAVLSLRERLARMWLRVLDWAAAFAGSIS